MLKIKRFHIQNYLRGIGPRIIHRGNITLDFSALTMVDDKARESRSRVCSQFMQVMKLTAFSPSSLVSERVSFSWGWYSCLLRPENVAPGSDWILDGVRREGFRVLRLNLLSLIGTFGANRASLGKEPGQKPESRHFQRDLVRELFKTFSSRSIGIFTWSSS
jgi:hypothetical protein